MARLRKQYGCQKIFSDHAKGAKADRPQWLELLHQIKSGDSLIIWKLDRIGRSLSHLIAPLKSSFRSCEKTFKKVKRHFWVFFQCARQSCRYLAGESPVTEG